MSSARSRIGAAVACSVVIGACQRGAPPDAAPAAVVRDLALAEHAAAARVGEGGGDARALTAQVVARADTMDASLRWYIAAGRVTEALRFATAMGPFWRSEGRVDDGRRLLAAALALPDSAPPSPQRGARARAWYEAGVLAFRQRDQDASRAANEKSLELATQLADREAIAQALVGLSRVELRAGEYDSVRAHAGRASALLREAGDTSGAIGPAHMVAAVDRMTGHDSAAAALYEQTLARFRAEHDDAGVAGEVMNLAYVRLHQGRRAEARSLLRDALNRFVALHDDMSQAFVLAAFGAVAADAGDAAAAAQLYGAAGKLLATGGVTLDPDDQYEFDRYSAKARQRLGEAAYTRAVADGAALGLAGAERLARRL